WRELPAPRPTRAGVHIRYRRLPAFRRHDGIPGPLRPCDSRGLPRAGDRGGRREPTVLAGAAMTAVTLVPWAAPAAASQRAEPREIGLLVAGVVARALRRLSWLATVETNVVAGDTPEAELHWQRESEAGRTMSAAVDLADSTLAELVDG